MFFNLFKQGKAKENYTIPVMECENCPDDIFLEEIEKSDFIKMECDNVVLQHMKGQINLNKTGDILSLEEKRKLGFSVKLKITGSLVNVLTCEAMQLRDPKDALKTIYQKAIFRHLRSVQLKKYKNLGISQIEILDCGDERDCLWCKSMNRKKISIDTDLTSLIDRNCKCYGHCRLTEIAVID